MQIIDTPLFVKTHDFILWLFRHTMRFPKHLRHSFTLKLENAVLEFQGALRCGGFAEQSFLTPDVWSPAWTPGPCQEDSRSASGVPEPGCGQQRIETVAGQSGPKTRRWAATRSRIGERRRPPVIVFVRWRDAP
jgi:hypothetical protein